MSPNSQSGIELLNKWTYRRKSRPCTTCWLKCGKMVSYVNGTTKLTPTKTFRRPDKLRFPYGDLKPRQVQMDLIFLQVSTEL